MSILKIIISYEGGIYQSNGEKIYMHTLPILNNIGGFAGYVDKKYVFSNQYYLKLRLKNGFAQTWTGTPYKVIQQ